MPAIDADRVELQQVLLNLIANSIDAMADTDSAARVLTVATVLTPAGMVKASVSDTGVGLQGIDLERIFKFAYTTKPTGTGVGLSISRSIVDAHGGELWAEQNHGSVATFSFTVPVHSVAVSTESAPQGPVQPI